MANSNRPPIGNEVVSHIINCHQCNTALENSDPRQDHLDEYCPTCSPTRATSPVAGPSGINQIKSGNKRKPNSSIDFSSTSPKSIQSSSELSKCYTPNNSGSSPPPMNKESLPISHVIRHLLGFKCTICGKEFTSRSNRSYHRYCDKNFKKPFQCGTCERVR